MKAIVGKKIGMGSIVDDKGARIGVTFIDASDEMVISKIKTSETDGYNAFVVATGKAKTDRKSILGQHKSIGYTPANVQEFRFDGETEIKAGDKLKVDQFEVGDKVQLTSTSKGKGYSGTVKKWNFSRGPESHGSKNVRLPGSIGSMYPQKVFKGKKMSGHMGSDRTTIKNIKIAFVDSEKGIIAVTGSVPGSNGSKVTVKAAV